MIDDTTKGIMTTAGAAAIILLILIVGLGSFYSIPGGSVGVLYNKMGDDKGFNSAELPQGWGFKVPVKQVVYDMPFRTQEIAFYDADEGLRKSTYSAITTKDTNGINFKFDVTIRYRLDPTQASEFVEQKGFGIAAMQEILATAARAEATRGVLGQYSQEDVPEHLGEITEEVRIKLQERIDSEGSGKLQPGFIIVEAVDIRKIHFNSEIEERIIQKQKKLQEAQEKEYTKQSAEIQREIDVVNADAQRQAAIIQAEGEAEAIRSIAFAKAAGIKAVSESYEDMNPIYAEIKFAEALKEIAESGNSVFMDIGRFQGGQNLGVMDYNKFIGGVKPTMSTSTTK